MNKICTSIEQSKKLMELGIDINTADMDYVPFVNDPTEYDCIINEWNNEHEEDWIPCWSLSALLNVLPKVINNETLFIETSPALWHIGYRNIYTARADNLVDACYEMIIKLHEKNLL